jgi:hypothetical protein
MHICVDPIETHEQNRQTTTFIDGNSTVTQPATRQSTISQLQSITCAHPVISNAVHLQGVILEDNENIYDDNSNWLHRNDAYIMQNISGRMRVVVTPSSGYVTQTNSNNIIGTTQCNIFRIWYVSDMVCAA